MESKRARAYLLVIVLGGIMVSVFLLLGPPNLLAKSSTPEFCSGCHTMESEYEAWVHSGAHRRKACVDCHLPNDNKMAHYLWKSIDGAKDVLFFYSGSVPDRIQITEHGAGVLQANCVRCHESAVMNIDTGRKCWGCHRRIAHSYTGAIQTI